ncbi:MAG: bifunctional 5,10-methylenetetrahydrofolate dehydrogenase/5,10-methenyltetrahydrofolate cyclohydrolase [Pyrinomonadaceae bacterium]
MILKEQNSSMIKRATILDSARVANDIKREVAAAVIALWDEREVKPCLSAVRVGDDSASETYVRNKIKACEEVGIHSEHHALPATTSQTELLELITSLNLRPDVDGILIQMPLPKGIDESAILEAVNPAKDVDGFHPQNVGRLAMGHPNFVPCTPAGIMELLKRNDIEIRGADACVIGRSQIVGRPMAQLLIQSDATVTVCHSRTRDLAAVARRADILVVAIGRPGMVGADYIKPGATVIDVGMNRVTDETSARELFGEDADRRIRVIGKHGYTLVGDVHPAEADRVAGQRTPVPGGVGLLTVAMLLANTVKAARQRLE